MKALSINQPWAWLIARGFKDIENRDWPTSYRGDFYIHAGKNVDRDFDYKRWERLIGETIPLMPFTGGIIGQARIIDCVRESASPWFMGKHGFILSHQEMYHEPRPCKGALSFFEPDFNSRYKEPVQRKPPIALIEPPDLFRTDIKGTFK